LSNASVATVLAREWLKRNRPRLPDEAFFAGLVRGLETVHWPGRFERIGTEPEVYIDVGHTPDAVACLARTVRSALAGRPILLVAGVSQNKAADEIVAQLAALADEIICTRAYHNGSPVETIAGIARRHRPDVKLHEARRIEEAADLARGLALAQGMTVLAAGGLFLAAEFQYAWRGGDPQSLRFF
jgi:dihydrofolate synthase/folylpolyglutamate synthase